eukprot:2015880-Rhodomonas_salina.8
MEEPMGGGVTIERPGKHGSFSLSSPMPGTDIQPTATIPAVLLPGLVQSGPYARVERVPSFLGARGSVCYPPTRAICDVGYRRLLSAYAPAMRCPVLT